MLLGLLFRRWSKLYTARSCSPNSITAGGKSVSVHWLHVVRVHFSGQLCTKRRWWAELADARVCRKRTLLPREATNRQYRASLPYNTRGVCYKKTKSSFLARHQKGSKGILARKNDSALRPSSQEMQQKGEHHNKKIRVSPAPPRTFLLVNVELGGQLGVERRRRVEAVHREQALQLLAMLRGESVQVALRLGALRRKLSDVVLDVDHRRRRRCVVGDVLAVGANQVFFVCEGVVHQHFARRRHDSGCVERSLCI